MKLDFSSIPDSEIYIQGYSVFRNDRCRNNGGVARRYTSEIILWQLSYNLNPLLKVFGFNLKYLTILLLLPLFVVLHLVMFINLL